MPGGDHQHEEMLRGLEAVATSLILASPVSFDVQADMLGLGFRV